MPEIRETIVINADIAKVKKVFRDVANYSKWSSFIQYIKIEEGKAFEAVVPGDKLEVAIIIPESGKTTVMEPIVKANTEKQFGWTGTLFSGYLCR